jgi:adenylate cyclase
MDYTIIGNMVNMTSRLQSHAEVEGILMGHETYSLIKDVVAAEEQTQIKVKGSPSRYAATRSSACMTT